MTPTWDQSRLVWEVADMAFRLGVRTFEDQEQFIMDLRNVVERMIAPQLRGETSQRKPPLLIPQ